MAKHISRLKFLNLLFYLFFMLAIVYTQVLYNLNDEINQNIIGALVFVNSYIVFFYIVYNVKFISFVNREVWYGNPFLNNFYKE